MFKHINAEIDLEFEYKDEQLKFQMVPVTGTRHSCPATRDEPGWYVANLQIDMTAQEVQDWVVEDFEDNNKPAPPWAYTDGQAILIEMLDRVETLIGLG